MQHGTSQPLHLTQTADGRNRRRPCRGTSPRDPPPTTTHPWPTRGPCSPSYIPTSSSSAPSAAFGTSPRSRLASTPHGSTPRSCTRPDWHPKSPCHLPLPPRLTPGCRRSSLWIRHDERGWLMRFHQGTPTSGTKTPAGSADTASVHSTARLHMSVFGSRQARAVEPVCSCRLCRCSLQV